MTDRIGNSTVPGGDAGNSRSSAVSVSLNNFGNANITGSTGFGFDGGDYYRFVAPASGSASFSLTGLSEDLDLGLYTVDSSGPVSVSSNYLSLSERISYNVTLGSTYYVQVDPYGAAESNYHLSLNLPAGDTTTTGDNDRINGSRVSGGDAGNSRSSATNVSLDMSGDASITGSAGYDTDTDDYYQFVAPASGTATFSLTGLSEDLDLHLLNREGTALYSSATGGSSSESISYSLDGGSSYYIWVDPSGCAESAYALDVDLPAGTGNGVDIDPIDLLIDGEPYYQSGVMSADGEIIVAEMAQVFRQYLGGLGREPGTIDGFLFWYDSVVAGQRTLVETARGFINTTEFHFKADENGDSIVTDEEFVDHMYFNVFGRAPAESGRNFWLDSIDRSSQAVAFTNMLESPEFVENTVYQVSDWSFWNEILLA